MNTFIRLIENALHPFRVLGAYFGRFFRFGGKKFKLTLAGKLSIAFFICFAIFITVICIIRIFDPDAYFFKSITKHLFNKEIVWVDIPLYSLSAILISIGLYWGIRVAIREKPSLYPEIDQCWEPIEKWRQKQNLDWNEFNRYLVLVTVICPEGEETSCVPQMVAYAYSHGSPGAPLKPERCSKRLRFVMSHFSADPAGWKAPLGT